MNKQSASKSRHASRQTREHKYSLPRGQTFTIIHHLLLCILASKPSSNSSPLDLRYVFVLYAATTFLLVSSRVPLHPADTEDVLVFKYEGEYCKLGSHQRFKKVSKSCR